ncbi:CDP-alcohol phosphatidyltransferase family protein [Candidatus Aenigmatarchaeota archaeon]
MLYKKREYFEGLSIRMGKLFSKLPPTPNQWTMFSIISAIVAFFFIINEWFAIGAIFFVIAALSDHIDGSVARHRKVASKIGAYIDTICDRYVDFIILLALFFIPLPNFFLPVYAWVALAIFGTQITTYAKAAAKEKGLSNKELRGGLLERPERLILILIGLILAIIDKTYLTYVIVIIAILANITALQRIHKALHSQ